MPTSRAKYHLHIAPKIVEFLMTNPRSKNELGMLTAASGVTVQRSLRYLRDRGVPIRFSRHDLQWHIDDLPSLELSLAQLKKKRVISSGQAVIMACEFYGFE